VKKAAKAKVKKNEATEKTNTKKQAASVLQAFQASEKRKNKLKGQVATLKAKANKHIPKTA